MTTVVDEEGRLLGMISDGDLRRQIDRHGYTERVQREQRPKHDSPEPRSHAPGQKYQLRGLVHYNNDESDGDEPGNQQGNLGERRSHQRVKSFKSVESCA